MSVRVSKGAVFVTFKDFIENVRVQTAVNVFLASFVAEFSFKVILSLSISVVDLGEIRIVQHLVCNLLKTAWGHIIHAV